MALKPIRGICPIVAAPFLPDGALDYAGLGNLTAHLSRAGVHGLTLFGLATEYYKLTDAERTRMLAAMMGRIDGPAAIASVTAHSWEVAVQQAREYAGFGVDALMVMPPFFLGPPPGAIREHLLRVAGAVDLPLIVQYAPAQTGVRLPAAFFAALQREAPNVRYVKVECQPPGPFITELSEQSGGTLRALVGYAGLQMPDAVRRGVAGIQPGSSLAEIYLAIWHRYEAGDLEGGDALHARFLPWISDAMQSVELIIKLEKVILARRGLIASDYCRAPAAVLDPGQLEALDRHLSRLARIGDLGGAAI